MMLKLSALCVVPHAECQTHLSVLRPASGCPQGKYVCARCNSKVGESKCVFGQ